MTALAEALSHAVLHAADDGVRRDLQKRLGGRDVALLARAGDDLLFTVPMAIREDYDQFVLFFMGRLLESAHIKISAASTAVKCFATRSCARMR